MKGKTSTLGFLGLFLAFLAGLFSFWLLIFSSPSFAYETEASWYSVSSCEREGTTGIMANGAPLVDSVATCASWDYPLGTRLKVTCGGKSILVTVTDRGPSRMLYEGGRRLDLSKSAFQKLSKLSAGIMHVKVEKVR